MVMEEIGLSAKELCCIAIEGLEIVTEVSLFEENALPPKTATDSGIMMVVS